MAYPAHSEKYEYDFHYKILICGSAGVGKTSVLMRFVDDKFRVSHFSTTGIDFMMKYVIVKGKKVQLQIWDTAGQERYANITKQYYRRAQGILLTYDITDQKSFDSLPKWVKELENNMSESVPIVLLGNKVDLEGKRQVDTTMGAKFAQQHNMQFFETSCLASLNITEALHTLIEEMLFSEVKTFADYLKTKVLEEAVREIATDVASESIAERKKGINCCIRC